MPVPVLIPHTYFVLGVESGAPSRVAVRMKLAPLITAETLWISWPGNAAPDEFVKLVKTPDVVVTVVAKAELAVSAAADAKAATRADFIDWSLRIQVKRLGYFAAPVLRRTPPRSSILLALRKLNGQRCSEKKPVPMGHRDGARSYQRSFPKSAATG